MLLAARAVEQGALALMLIVLARRLGPELFAPVSVLFVVNSLAVTASDFGLGLDLLRLPQERVLALAALRRVQLANFFVGVGALMVGLVIGGLWGAVIVTSGLIWGLSAEAYIRGAGALRRGLARHTAVADVAASLFALVAVLALATGDGVEVVLVTGLALAARHLIGAAMLRGWRADFSTLGERARPTTPWISQLLAFATANVDYLVAGIFLGPQFLSIYLVALRLANAAPSQIANVTNRIAVADFAAASSESRQGLYSRVAVRVGLIASAAALATAAAAPLLPWLLGPSWSEVAPVAVVLATAVPARMLAGIAGALALATHAARLLIVVEVGRLAATAAALFAAALIGAPIFVVAASVVATGSTAVIHYAIARHAQVRTPAWMWPSTAACIALAVACGMLLR